MKIKLMFFGALKMLFALLSVLSMVSVDSDDWVKPLIGVFVFAFLAFVSYVLEVEVS